MKLFSTNKVKQGGSTQEAGNQPPPNPFGDSAPAELRELGLAGLYPGDEVAPARGTGGDAFDLNALLAQAEAAERESEAAKAPSGIEYQSAGAQKMTNAASKFRGQIESLKNAINKYEADAKDLLERGKKEDAMLAAEMRAKVSSFKTKLQKMSNQMEKRAIDAEAIYFEQELINAERELAEFLNNAALEGHNKQAVIQLRSALNSLAAEHQETSNILMDTDPFAEFDADTESDAAAFLNELEKKNALENTDNKTTELA